MRTITILHTCEKADNIILHMLYFVSEEDLLTLAEMILEPGNWNTTGGKWKMVVIGKETTTYYTSKINHANLLPISDYKLLWEYARDIAKRKLGMWVWLFANDFVRRAATLRYIETAKREAHLAVKKQSI